MLTEDEKKYYLKNPIKAEDRVIEEAKRYKSFWLKKTNQYNKTSIDIGIVDGTINKIIGVIDLEIRSNPLPKYNTIHVPKYDLNDQGQRKNLSGKVQVYMIAPDTSFHLAWDINGETLWLIRGKDIIASPEKLVGDEKRGMSFWVYNVPKEKANQVTFTNLIKVCIEKIYIINQSYSSTRQTTI